jgi:hypothetical protein
LGHPHIVVPRFAKDFAWRASASSFLCSTPVIFPLVFIVTISIQAATGKGHHQIWLFIKPPSRCPTANPDKPLIHPCRSSAGSDSATRTGSRSNQLRLSAYPGLVADPVRACRPGAWLADERRSPSHNQIGPHGVAVEVGEVEGVSGVFIWLLAKESLGEWRSATSAPSSFSMAIGRE